MRDQDQHLFYFLSLVATATRVAPHMYNDRYIITYIFVNHSDPSRIFVDCSDPSRLPSSSTHVGVATSLA